MKDFGNCDFGTDVQHDEPQIASAIVLESLETIRKTSTKLNQSQNLNLTQRFQGCWQKLQPPFFCRRKSIAQITAEIISPSKILPHFVHIMERNI